MVGSPDAQPEGTGEQTLTLKQRRRLQQCYDHATRLMEQEAYDFDYAHTMLVECVATDPGNLVYLDAFFANLHRKFGTRRPASLLRFGRSGFKKARARNDWSEVIRSGTQLLGSDPGDVATLRGMAEACAARGHHETELRYLREALGIKPKDPDVNRHCARSLTRIGDFVQAIACWQRVDELKDGDAEAQEEIAQLQSARMGLTTTPAGTTRGTASGATGASDEPAAGAKDEPAAPSATGNEPSRRSIPLTRRQQLEQAVRHAPADVEPYFELADLHLAEGRLGDASFVLNKALAASGNQIAVQERIEDVEILRKRQQVTVAAQRARRQPSDEADLLASDLQEDLHRFELEVFDRRCQRYPDDLEYRFQLGLRLKRLGKYREAIAEFERARGSQRRRTMALFEQGECLQRLKQYGPALDLYTTVADQVEEPETDGDHDLRAMALYRSGVLASGLGNLAAAEDYFTRLVAADPDYRDAAARLDKIGRMRHKG